jgi:acylphosphatase
MIARRVVVHGRVQGVGLRWHTSRSAARLGIVGWVRNLPDGTVEAHVEGDEAAVARMVAWLASGPASARVTRCDVSETAPTAAVSFVIDQ